MPEFTVTHIALLAITMAVGAVAGWVLRGNRAEQEKTAVSAGWQEQIEAQRKEADRLLEQNKSLMEQVSQYQASNMDAKNRAKELSVALQETLKRRDELQREIKDIRSNLEVAVTQRNQLQSDVAARDADQELLRQKDARIEKLSLELENWQIRLPPLVERFRVRNEEAEQLEADLAAAQERIHVLESEQANATETRIEPVRDPEELTDGLDASNDPADDYVDEFVVDDEPETEAEPEAEREAEREPEAETEAQTDDVAMPEYAYAAHHESSREHDGVDRRDDLKMIKGVGPAIEKTLNELGIFSYRQIADMSEYDIDRVARKLKGFHSRIYREDWIGQARALLDRAAHA